MRFDQKKIDRLLEVREVRRKSSERRLMAARNAEEAARSLETGCKAFYGETVDTAAAVRQSRLEAIFAAEDRHGLHQSRAVSAYEATQQEIDQARQAWKAARAATAERERRTVLAQREMARFMQVEAKVRHLSRECSRLQLELANRQS
ncbi:MAG: hypothetical protein KDJ66_01590 [Nitratireductor sp.]|nr:hypothetical protein [Nitratireductor sp.]